MAVFTLEDKRTCGGEGRMGFLLPANTGSTCPDYPLRILPSAILYRPQPAVSLSILLWAAACSLWFHRLLIQDVHRPMRCKAIELATGQESTVALMYQLGFWVTVGLRLDSSFSHCRFCYDLSGRKPHDASHRVARLAHTWKWSGLPLK